MLSSKPKNELIIKNYIRTTFFIQKRYLLNFGQVTKYLGYNALLDYFPTMTLKPNESCSDSFCVKRQKEFQEREAQRLAEEANKAVVEEQVDDVDLHPDNEFRN